MGEMLTRVVCVTAYLGLLSVGGWSTGIAPGAVVGETNAELIDLAWRFLRSEDPFNWEAQEQSSDIMDRRQIAAAVLMADERVVEGLFQILETTPLDGPDAPRVNLHSPLRKLGVIASVDPKKVDAKRLIRIVERIEQSRMPINRFLELTADGYWALGRTDDKEALAFIKKRTSLQFWEEGDYPLREEIRKLLETNAWITIRGSSISEISPIGDPEGTEIVKELLEDFEIEGDQQGMMAARVELTSAEWKARYHQALLDSIERVRAERGLAGESGLVKDSAAPSSHVIQGQNAIISERQTSNSGESSMDIVIWFGGLLAAFSIAMVVGYVVLRQRK